MNREQVALELTKLYFEQQDTIPSAQSIKDVYFSFLNSL